MSNTIRQPHFFRKILPYQQLAAAGAFGNTQIYPQDIDGEVEINGHFLWMEWQHVSKEESKAQMCAIVKRLIRMRGYGMQFWIIHNSPAHKLDVQPGDIMKMSVGCHW